MSEKARHNKPIGDSGRQIHELRGRYEESISKGMIPSMEVDEFLDLADWLYSTKSIDQALEVLDNAETLYPGDNTLMACRGIYLLEQGKIEEAKEVADRITDRGDTDVRLLRGAIALMEGNYDEAMAIFRDPALEDIHPLEVAYSLSQTGYKKEAMEIIENYQPQENDDERFYLGLKADLKSDLGHYEEAVEIYNHILDKDPYDSQNWFELGRCHMFNNQVDKAIESMEYAIAIDPGFTHAYQVLGECQIVNGDNQEGFSNLDTAARLGCLDLDEITAFINEDLLFRNEEELSERLLMHIRELGCFDSESQAMVSYHIYELHRDKEDVLDYEPFIDEALSLQPDNLAYLYTKGYLRTLEDDHLSARKYFMAISDATQTSLPLLQITGLMIEFGQGEDAMRYLQRALEMDSPESLCVQSMVYDFPHVMQVLNAYFMDEVMEPRELMSHYTLFKNTEDWNERDRIAQDLGILLQQRLESRRHRR